MFDQQEALEVRTLGEDWRPWDGRFPISMEERENLTRLTKEFCTCMQMETAELLDWTPWKHWSQSLGNKRDKFGPDNPDPIRSWSPEHVFEIRREIIDQLHFWLALALIWRMSPQDVYDVYTNKNSVNHERQEQGDY